jgi:hypothetical protein
MLALRYSPGKIWANFALAMVAGIVIVFVLSALWDRTVIVGGLCGVLGVGIMLFIGCIKRSGMREPILIVDGRGITIGLAKFGTIPWSSIQSTALKGIPWFTSVRLVIEVDGQVPKASFGEKLNWLIQTRQKGESARVQIAALELTDQPVAALQATLAARGQARS